MDLRYFVVFALSLSACTDHITMQHMEIEEHTGFLNKYVYTSIKGDDGKPIPGTEKLTICNGYGGLISDAMKSAAVVAGAYFIGQGIADSGDVSNSNTRINNGSNSGAVSGSTSNATSNATSGAAAISGSSVNNYPAMQPKPHHFKELKPHEYKSYGID